jgi:tRNA-2-methylthio-N6-dimethylallyladenosine synthase
MNVHDSERIAGLLDADGYVPAQPGSTPDVVVFNTCAVRENADNRLYGNLGHLKPVKDATPGHADRRRRLPRPEGPGPHHARAPWVDVVFGTHNVGSLPVLLERAASSSGAGRAARVARGLPVDAARPARVRVLAWVSISSAATTPAPSASSRACAARRRTAVRATSCARSRCWPQQGVLEVTLLGQNVNSYGRSFGERGAFADLLRAVGRGRRHRAGALHQPHPRDFTDDVIAAMAETPAVCPSLHMPLQSGSDAVLKAMRRSYRSERFLGILDRVRAAIPDAAITTDVIVGFPARPTPTSRTPCASSRPAASPAPSPSSTPRGPGRRRPTCRRCPGRSCPSGTTGSSPCRTGSPTRACRRRWAAPSRCLVSSGEGRKDTGDRLTGRARDNRLVHLAGAAGVRPGDLVETVVTGPGPHYLVADGALLSHRRTAAGDALGGRPHPEHARRQPRHAGVGVPAPLPRRPPALTRGAPERAGPSHGRPRRC